jgi:hypothetical protein
MATIVCHKTRETEAVGSTLHSIYEVVDGQQRLTTLIVLLKSISKSLRTTNTIDSLREAEDLDRLLVKGDGRLIILQNNHDNRQILRNYLERGILPAENDIRTNADKNINNAIKDCERQVALWANDIDLLTLVKNCLFFIFQTVEDKGSVYTIFEVLNSRGLEVDWLDKTKSVLMGLLFDYSYEGGNEQTFPDNLNENHGYWTEIYRQIGQNNIPGHEVIRFTATLKSTSNSGRPLNTEDSMEFFREYCNAGRDLDDKIRRVREVTIWLKDVTFKLKDLYDDTRRNAVTEITQARLLALSILLRSDFSLPDQQRLLDQWERVTFRIYGMYSKDSRNKVGDYVRAAKIIHTNSTLTIAGIMNLIKEIGADYPIEGAVTELLNGDCYNGWHKELCYFLFKYEEYLSAQSGIQLNHAAWSAIWDSNPNSTIEHILPQGDETIRLPAWNHFNADQFKKNVQRLGNLTLLAPGLNSEAGQRGFADKLNIYDKVPLQILNDIKNNGAVRRTNWTTTEIEARTNTLITFATTQWADLP